MLDQSLLILNPPETQGSMLLRGVPDVRARARVRRVRGEVQGPRPEARRRRPLQEWRRTGASGAERNFFRIRTCAHFIQNFDPKLSALKCSVCVASDRRGAIQEDPAVRPVRRRRWRHPRRRRRQGGQPGFLHPADGVRRRQGEPFADVLNVLDQMAASIEQTADP